MAAATAHPGCESLLPASVGADPFGGFLVDTLERYGVHTESIKKDPHTTTMAFVSLNRQGGRRFVNTNPPFNTLSKEGLA